MCARHGSVPTPKVVAGSHDKEKLLPEDGFLASDSYTNRFFGFSIELPITSEGHRITIPVMLEKQHALLAIGFEQGKRFGRMVITAEESPKELPWYDDVQAECARCARFWFRTTTAWDSSFMLHFGSFYANQAHRGSYHIHHYWTRIRSYIIRVAVESNDPEFLKKSKDGLRKGAVLLRRKKRPTDHERRQGFRAPRRTVRRTDGADLACGRRDYEQARTRHSRRRGS